MKKVRKIGLVKVLLIFCSYGGFCQQSPPSWYITPVFLRDYYGNILEDSSYVSLNMRFKSKIPLLVAFDYGEIYSRSFKSCEKRNIESSMSDLLLEFDVSQILLQNEGGYFIPLMDNMIDPPVWGQRCRTSTVDVAQKYNYSIIQLIPNEYVEIKFRYAIRLCALTVCNENTKIRLIYIQKPNLYLQKMGVSQDVFVSDWFDVSKIK
jgi:hypothetical protein